MSNRTVSSAFEKELHRLSLHNFPYGQGSWEAETWGPQAAALRERCVTSPARLAHNAVCEYFTTLRIVDKGVSVIDDGVLRFTRLKELVLTANHISHLPSAHLPRSLRVLEVCANQVSSLQSLSQHPPPHLQHLGLAFNKLGSASDAQLLTASFWPALVSLDLSWCGFVEQLVLVDSLSTLPQLRTLGLEGNPLTLTPSYPGLLLDSLPRLLYLDSRRVTPDERHRFRGMAHRRDDITSEAVVTVRVQRMRGVPNPSLASDSSAPEFPIITYSYLVTYEFLSPAENKVGRESVAPPGLAVSFASDGSLGCSRGPGEQDEPPQEVQRYRGEELHPTTPHTGPPAGNGGSRSSESGSCPVMEKSTPNLPWADPIEYRHAHVYHITDLVSLKSFFLRGLRVTVEEEKVLSWPASPGENMGTKPVTDKKRTAKEQSARPTNNTCSTQKCKDKRRKKERQVELVQDPPIRRTLGSAHLELKDLVSGGNQVYRRCDFGVPTEQSDRTPQEKEPSKKVREDKKKEEKKAKAGGENIATQRTTPSKGKNKGKKASDAEAFHTLPRPLVLEISIHLDKWPTA